MSEYQANPGPDGGETPPPPPPSGLSSTQKGIAIAAVALLLGGIAGVGIAALTGDDDPKTETLSEQTPSPTPTDDLPTPTETPEVTPSASGTPTVTPSGSASPSPSASASPRATASGTAGPTVAPTSTASPTPAAGTVTMTFTLDKTSAKVGDKVTGLVTIRNDRNTAIKLSGDCRFANGNKVATVTGQLSEGPVAATALNGKLKEFHDNAAKATPRPTYLESGLSPCTGEPKPYTLGARTILKDRYVWTASSVNGSLYNGGFIVSATSGYRTAEAPNGPLTKLTAPSRTLLLSGGSSARLTADQAVDAALADNDFKALVNSSDRSKWPPASGTNYVEYFGATGTFLDLTTNTWVVSVVQSQTEEGDSGMSVTVNPTTGEVGEPEEFTRNRATA